MQADQTLEIRSSLKQINKEIEIAFSEIQTIEGEIFYKNKLFTGKTIDRWENGQIKELKTYYKELKSFFTEQNTIKNIKEILKANNLEIIDNTTILNLFSGSGNLINCLYDLNNINNKLNSNNITLCDNNKLLNIIAYANLQINTGISFDNQYNIIETDLLHDNRITNNYDIIIADLPHDIRNIIHAECCNKIKQYKILELIPDIRKYFSFTSVIGASEPDKAKLINVEVGEVI